MNSLLTTLTFGSCLFSLALGQSANFANNLQQCVKRDSSKINNCLFSTLEELRGFMGTGIPELNLQPTDPLRIKNIEFASPVPLVNVTSKFSNVRAFTTNCVFLASIFVSVYFIEVSTRIFYRSHG